MRIISDFHDYYDSVQKYGQDSSTVYLRKNEVVEISEVLRKFPGKYDTFLNMKNMYTWTRTPIDSITLEFVFFCGTVYPSIFLKKYEADKGFINFRISEIDVMDGTLEVEFGKKSTEDYHKNTFNDFFNRKNVEQFFSFKGKEIDLNLDLKCPIISLHIPSNNRNKLLQLNPSLKDIEFYKQVETGLAFQQIESFVGGVLTTSPVSMVKVNEKTRLEKRGFDSKLSFRKGKSSQKD